MWVGTKDGVSVVGGSVVGTSVGVRAVGLALVALAHGASVQTKGADMNIRQRVLCDMCAQDVDDCFKYNPDPFIFNGEKPKPTALGKLYQCPPSDRDTWTTDDSFKVEDEDRPECPCFDKSDGISCKRRADFNGKLGFARGKICQPLISGMPKGKRIDKCTRWVQKVQPNSQGGSPPDCNLRRTESIKIDQTEPVKNDAVGAAATGVVITPDNPPEEENVDDDNSPAPFRFGELNVRQRIACDICYHGVKQKDCSKYTPTSSMLDPALPKPSKLGSLLNCPPSELQLWTENTVKIDVGNTGEIETRKGCPCYNKLDCRRQPVFDGKLSFARSKICAVLSGKRMPKQKGQCSAWVDSVVSVSGRTTKPDCGALFASGGFLDVQGGQAVPSSKSLKKFKMESLQP